MNNTGSIIIIIISSCGSVACMHSGATDCKYCGVEMRGVHLRYCIIGGDRGGTVVKALRYKSEGCWFDPSWCHWNFSLI